MKIKINIELTFDNPFNVGAGALGGSLADKPLTRDARGLPMVPASSFKGRLRHEIERLAPHLRPNDRPPCQSPVAEMMCQGNEPPCPVCQLFGSPWYEGRLNFSNFLLEEPSFLKTTSSPLGDLRSGVGLSRYRKVAEDQLLYTTEIFQPGTPIVLQGTIIGEIDESGLNLLNAGLESLFTVGGGKTRGLGWFDLQVKDISEREEAAEPISLAKNAEVLDVFVELNAPLLLGTDADEAYYKVTHDYIPGRVLRGSLAKMMLTDCSHPPDDPHADCAFGLLFGSDTPPIFEYLYPTSGYDFSMPMPLTARSCKYHSGFRETKRQSDQGHGVGDILIRQSVFEQVLKAHLQDQLSGPLPIFYQPRCPECRADVDLFSGNLIMLNLGRTDDKSLFQFDNVAIPIRRSSHTAINRHRAVAADGQLFTLETIEPEDTQGHSTTFRGVVRGSPAQIQNLRQWLPRLPALGRGQSRGLGHVQIETLKSDIPLPELSERLKAFNAKFRREWGFFEVVAGLKPLTEDTIYFCLTLISPTALTWQGMSRTTILPEMLGFNESVKLIRAFTDHQTLSGWHLGAGLPRRTQQTITMGSVFLYRSEGLARSELEKKLSQLEETGIGISSLRRQGLGRVVVCLPFHYQPEVTL